MTPIKPLQPTRGGTRLGKVAWGALLATCAGACARRRGSAQALDRMSNNEAKARAWLEFLAREPAVPFGPTLRAHFDAGRITRLCDCGCNSFDLEIPKGVALEPLAEPGPSGRFFEVVYEASAEAEMAFLIFADARGYLSGLDVTYGDSNHAPLPDDTQLRRVLYAGS